ncbi:MAG: hypothetical protein IJY09_00695 [Lachnospiraceae bacterium]|nr:hypothetical protein [Lachnospiraceae bacterium]
MKKIKKLFAMLLVTLTIAGSVNESFPTTPGNIVNIHANQPIEDGGNDYNY